MARIKIKGMSCEHCRRAVARALESVDGVSEVAVDLAAGEAVFRAGPEVSEAAVLEAVRRAGYEAAYA